MPHLRGGAVAVIRQDGNDYRNIARAVAFVGDFFVINGRTFARRLFDRTSDVVVGHVVGFCLGDNVAEFIVVDRIRPALFNGDGELSADLGKDASALRIRLFLFIFNVGPLGMS
jgi:hypothetical protein